MRKRRGMLKLFLIIVSVSVSLLAGPSSHLHAQAVLKTIEQVKARGGDEKELIVRNENLFPVVDVDSVLIDGRKVQTFEYIPIPDSLEMFRVRIQVPSELEPGRYRVEVWVSCDPSEACLEPP